MHWGWQDKFLKSCRTHICPSHSGKETGAVLCLSLYGQMMPSHSIGSYWKSKRDSIVLCSWGEFSCYIMDRGSQGKCPTRKLLMKEPCKMCAVCSRAGGGLLLDFKGQSCEDWIWEQNLQLYILPTGFECLGKDNFSTYNISMAKAAKMAISTEAQKRLISTPYTNQLERGFLFVWQKFFGLFFF